MHAFIVSGSTKQDRETRVRLLLSEWKINQFSVVTVEPKMDESVGVEDIRRFAHAIRLAPAKGSLQAGIFYDAHFMTTHAQNALLKLLEEPPPSVRIILETAQPDSLITTIHSRCVHIRANEFPASRLDNTRAPKAFRLDQWNLSGKTLAALSEYGASKEAARQFLLATLKAFAQSPEYSHNHGGLRSVAARALTRLLLALSYCESNVHPQLAIDSLLFDDIHADSSTTETFL